MFRTCLKVVLQSQEQLMLVMSQPQIIQHRHLNLFLAILLVLELKLVQQQFHPLFLLLLSLLVLFHQFLPPQALLPLLAPQLVPQLFLVLAPQLVPQQQSLALAKVFLVLENRTTSTRKTAHLLLQ